MIDPRLAKSVPIDNAVDVFKYKGKYDRDVWDPIPVDKMDVKKFVHACRFPMDALRGMFRGGYSNDASLAGSILSARSPGVVAFRQKFCLPGTTAMHEPDYACSSKVSYEPLCYMKHRMDPESRGESESKQSHSWSPPHFWGEAKLLPKEWASKIYPSK